MPYKRNKKEAAYGRNLDSRQPAEWSHPELVKWWVAGNADSIDMLCDDSIPLEKRLKRQQKFKDAAAEMYANKPYDPFNGIDWKAKDTEGNFIKYAIMTKYEARGCPEEPETPTNVYLTLPTTPIEGKIPVIYYVMGGALFTHDIRIFPEIMRWARDFNCAVVAADYRSPLEGVYPAAINDLHAGYQWISDHADEYNLDADNVTLFGESTGAHLALALAFRLKRYGFKPRGCVANDPMVDDRNYWESNKLIKDPCDATRAHAMFATYVGWENCGTNLLGPEAFANHATVEECKYLCPVYLNVGESDQDRDATMEFAGKLYAAKVPCSLHVWQGAAHATLYYARKTEMAKIFWDNLNHDIKCCMKYDMRRDEAWFEKMDKIQAQIAAEREAAERATDAEKAAKAAKKAAEAAVAAEVAAAAEKVEEVVAEEEGMSIEKAVIDAVAASYERAAADLTMDTDISKFDNNSSTKVIKTAMFISENLDLEEELEFEDLADFCTVGEIVNMLKERLG
jgi:acetyl esterase/lipase